MYTFSMVFKLLVLAVVLGLLVGGCVMYSVSHEEKPVVAKIMLGDSCVDTTMSIQDWYFQQKLLIKLGLEEQLTRLCN